MDELYARVSSTTKQALYQFIKDQDVSLLNYHFDYYFRFCIQENNIQVIPHHFSNHKIEGLTVVDELGTSFSYERDILDHEGAYFAESVDNQEDILEREANIFSAVVLMPDIVLLSKIYYSCETFHQVKNSLEVSKQALFFRLLDFLREYYSGKDSEIKQAVETYIEGKNASIFRLLHDIREQIIEEFHQFQPSLINQVKQRVSKLGFTTSQEYPDLLNQDNWKAIKEENINLKTWLIYNKGKSIAYVWDKEKFSDEEARKKAEIQLLLM